MVLLLLGLGGCFVLSYVGKRVLKSVEQRVAEYTRDYQAQGFQKITSDQDMVIVRDVTEKTLYVAPRVILDADSTADIAIIATQARITGHIQGTLNFKGQALIIGRTAVIDQDLDVAAQAVTVRGTVHGKLQGVYQQLIEGEDTP
jgi:hypothetical protein